MNLCFHSIEIFFFNQIEDKPYLELLLSVAVGSQLADVFLHLLPEAFAHENASSFSIGLWTLFGLFVFFLIEQIFPDDEGHPYTKKLERDNSSTVFNQIEKCE